ncbi:MAG TPA: hypothetical protein VFH59_09875 [Frateuria sp.]|uniref:hypothetical protein n=1 Tax=Frateuria sp. TaxID=2211372 RepID=UPI002D7EA2EB|nr:hypothetical protein [Frateuria sp.]HET6805735.1 hypothetical protein [Frateuria sp.]
MMFWLLVVGFVALAIAYIDANVKLAYAERRLREMKAEREEQRTRNVVNLIRRNEGPIISPMGIDWAKRPDRALL